MKTYQKLLVTLLLNLAAVLALEGIFRSRRR